MAIKSNKSKGKAFDINFKNAEWLKNEDIVGKSFTIYHILKVTTKRFGKKWAVVFTNAEESAVKPVVLIAPSANQAHFDEITNEDIEEIGGLQCEMTKKTSKNGNEYYKLEW